MLKFFILVSVFLSSIGYAADIAILQSQAQANNVSAQYALALAYQQGDGTTKDLSQALIWFEKAAKQGNVNAMQQLVDAYQQGKGTQPDTQKVRYWLTQLALNGAPHAARQLGNYYANLPTPTLPTSALAELWYEIGSARDPQAQQQYAKLLQDKFNQQRARQVASINQLEQAVSHSSAAALPEMSPSEPQPPETVGYVNHTDFLTVLLIGFVMALMWLVRIKRSQKRTHQHEQEQLVKQRQYQQDEQLLKQSRTIKQQKQQLQRLVGQLQQLQKRYHALEQQPAPHTQTPPDPSPAPEPPHHKMSVACALLGYTPQTLPDNKSIKARYKQLCKIYHPDMKGSDEEMKRLNNAVKYILAQRR